MFRGRFLSDEGRIVTYCKIKTQLDKIDQMEIQLNTLLGQAKKSESTLPVVPPPAEVNPDCPELGNDKQSD
jgi:hypothetical protein